jgi:hypothetical protein
MADEPGIILMNALSLAKGDPGHQPLAISHCPSSDGTPL